MTDEEAKRKICPRTFYCERSSQYSDIFRYQKCIGNQCMAFQLKFINDENSDFCKLLEGEMK